MLKVFECAHAYILFWIDLRSDKLNRLLTIKKRKKKNAEKFLTSRRFHNYKNSCDYKIHVYAVIRKRKKQPVLLASLENDNTNKREVRGYPQATSGRRQFFSERKRQLISTGITEKLNQREGTEKTRQILFSERAERQGPYSPLTTTWPLCHFH